MMNYPIDFSFKILAIASQIYIRDSERQLLGLRQSRSCSN